MKGTFCDNCEEKRPVDPRGTAEFGWYTLSMIQRESPYNYVERHFCSEKCLRVWVEDQTCHV